MNYTNESLSTWLTQGMWGIIPMYGQDGCNGSTLLFNNGPPLKVGKKVQSVIKAICALYQKDVNLVRKYASQFTGIKSLNPLPITPEVILVPVKIRKPVGKNDGATGYIFHLAIDAVKANDSGCILHLKDNTQLQVLDSVSTMKRRINITNMIYKIIKDRTFAGYCLEEMSAVYDKPATKGDIIMLSQSMVNFINMIKSNP